MHPLWFFLTGLVVGLGSIFALQARWSRTRQLGASAREALVWNALGWFAAVVAGLAAHALIQVVLPQAQNRETAIASALVGVAAFTLASGLARRRPKAPQADFSGAATSGLLQLAVLVGFSVALVFGTYWLFGN